LPQFPIDRLETVIDDSTRITFIANFSQTLNCEPQRNTRQKIFEPFNMTSCIEVRIYPHNLMYTKD